MVDLQAAHEKRQAQVALRAGQFADAHEQATRLLRSNKNDLDLLRVVAQSALRMGRFDEAVKAYERALALQPADLLAAVDLARALMFSGKFREARLRLQRILDQKPGFLPAVVALADLLDRSGEDEAIENLVQPFVQAGTDTAPLANVYARTLQRAGKFEQVIALTEKHLKNNQIDHQMRDQLSEKAARAYEKLGQFDKAFEAYSRSNALRARPFDPTAFMAHTDQLISVFAESNLAKLPRARVRSELPVFIAALPRSGSTLVEQIIHAHPKAYGAGEINEFHSLVYSLGSTLGSMWPYPQCLGDLRQEHADALARKYLASLSQYDRKASRIVNKNLDNYQCLGMVELLLPGARIVHVQRDAMDNCFSIFMAQIATNMHHWSTDLRSIALAYREYERAMAHWKRVLKTPILDVPYDELVQEPEPWIRRVIDFCGLPWDDRCLRYWEAERVVMTVSYDQVTQPIYTSAQKRWKKYEAFLGPLKEALGVT